MKKFILVFISCSIVFGCNPETKIEIHSPTFKKIDSSHSNIDFNNTIIEYPDQNISTYEAYYGGGGVAIGDINNDHLPDLFFTGNIMGNKLYLNKGNFVFEDITKQAGVEDIKFWSAGANMYDFNDDGWLDIYVCHSGPDYFKDKQNHLFINNKNGTFTESAKEMGLIDNSYSSQSAPIDFDMDGDIDIFLVNNNNLKTETRLAFRGKRAGFKRQHDYTETLVENNRDVYENVMFENVGGGQFKRVKNSPLSNWGYALGLSISDLDKDGKPDIYICNDFYKPDYVYYNQGGGNFIDKNKEVLKHNSQFSMGCDVADLNNDTWPDIVVVDMTAEDRVRNKTLMSPMNTSLFSVLTDELLYQKQFMFNVMQINNGNGTFSDIGQLTNTGQTDWSWSALLADFDLDGDKDYYVTNGFKRDTKNRDIGNQMAKIKRNNSEKSKEEYLKRLEAMPSIPLANYMYKNNSNFGFENVANDWGLDQKSFSNGAAYGDLDNDGDLDLVVNNIDQKAFVYQNLTQENNPQNYLKIAFDSHSKNLNAKITLFQKNKKQYQENHPTRGYWSTMDNKIIFGLGDDPSIDSLYVEWIDGKSLLLKNVEANQLLNIKYEQATKKVNSINENSDSKLLAKDLDIQNSINFTHEENISYDFEYEILLPHKQSTNGPSSAVGDVNKDGLDDFYIGGAQGFPGKLYLQESHSKFKESKSNQTVFAQDKQSEDIGSLFFDYDGDGDLDLYVVSGGGNDFNINASALKDRLYINDGIGNFTNGEEVFDSEVLASGSKIKANDFDKDGDLDLFVGGRVVPKKYPVPAKSIIWENENGKYVDSTSKLAPELEKIGMVTDFEWVDINTDGYDDLIVVGEWMNIEVFLQEEGHFKRRTDEYGLGDSAGWWFSICKSDVDNDGDIDFIVGNLGLNNKFHASDKKPLEIYFNDFDDNGSGDIVLAKMDEGNQYLLRGKDCSSEQMPFIQDKFPEYEAFANAPITQVLPIDKINESLRYSVTNFESILLINNGNSFEKRALPIEAQFFPIFDIVIKDLNKDGQEDLIVAGNLFGTEIETPPYDAGVGLILLNSNGQFTSQAYENSGLYSPFDHRDLDLIVIDGKEHLLITNNDGPLEVFKFQD